MNFEPNTQISQNACSNKSLPTRILGDAPISSSRQDQLHRQFKAAEIAKYLNKLNVSESFVIGIEGNWGSGKTSFINMITEYLSPHDVLVVNFNPWNYSDQNQILSELLRKILNTLLSSDVLLDKKARRKVTRYFSRYLRKLVRGINIFFFGFTFQLEKILGDKLLEEQKQDVNDALKEIGRKILVIMDDIDRLDSKEVKNIFKLIKLTADFSNVIFMVSYDRIKVQQMLEKEGFPGADYLQKIIQLPLPIPRSNPKDFFTILSFELRKTFTDSIWNDIDQERWQRIFNTGFKRLIQNVREIKRYINSLRWNMLGFCGNALNPIDYIAVEAVRVFATDVYSTLLYNKDDFILDNASLDNSRLEISRSLIQRVMSETVPQLYQEGIWAILCELFPQLDESSTKNNSFPANIISHWQKEKRVCLKENFDKYFILIPSIPDTAGKTIEQVVEMHIK